MCSLRILRDWDQENTEVFYYLDLLRLVNVEAGKISMFILFPQQGETRS